MRQAFGGDGTQMRGIERMDADFSGEDSGEDSAGGAEDLAKKNGKMVV
jgi:hypothetical protein